METNVGEIMSNNMALSSMGNDVNYDTVIRIARSIWTDDNMPNVEDLNQFAELLYAIGFTDGQRSTHLRARFVD